MNAREFFASGKWRGLSAPKGGEPAKPHVAEGGAVILCDSREPWPHPWEAYLPPGVTLEPATLETGDFSLQGLEDLVCIERKTGADLLGCIGSSRERFERELRRARQGVGRFAIIVEATLADLLRNAGGIHPNAIVGSLAAWTRRGAPVILAGSPREAAEFAWRYLLGAVKDGGRP